MEDINIVLKGIQKKIHQSPGCRYLYYYFDELVKCLKGWTKQYPNETPEELVKTIELYASECFFCCYNTPNWLMYAARSFYCADVLIEFVADEPSKCSLRETMCYYFNKLMDTDSIFLINSDILKRYSSCVVIKSKYEMSIRRAAYVASVHHPVSSKDEYWAYKACNYTRVMIGEYLKLFGDYSHLKEWIPALGTPQLSDIWFNLPEIFPSREHNRSMIQDIERFIDESLKLHMGLWKLWIQHDREEVVEVCAVSHLIDLLEVMDDDDFKEVVVQLASISNNNKVKSIITHFTEDDEPVVRDFAKKLLSSYD